MAKAKKKGKPAKKRARVVAKRNVMKKSAKPAAKKANRSSKSSARKSATPKIDPLNRKHYTALTPMLVVRDIRQAVHFYTNIFGFTLGMMMDSPQGPLHAELRLRDTTLMLSPESPAQQSFSASSIGGTPATLYVMVEDVDAVFNRAVAAGAKVLQPVMDMFWGDRIFTVADPEGNKWTVATHKAEPTEAEMIKARDRMMAQMSAQRAAAAAAAGSESEY